MKLALILLLTLPSIVGCKRTPAPSEAGTRPAVSAAASAAPSSPPPAQKCTAPRLAGETAEQAMLAALFNGWDRKAERAPIGKDEPVHDCFGHSASFDWSGLTEGLKRVEGQVIIKGHHVVDAEHSFYFVATSFPAGACDGYSGFLAYARVDANEARILASSEWSVECRDPKFTLRPLKLATGTVYAESPGAFGTGAGTTESERVWILNPPSLKAESFTVGDAPDCPMGTDEETCKREYGRLDVVAGSLRHRSEATTKRCRTIGEKTSCTPERTTMELKRYRLEKGELEEDAVLTRKEEAASHSNDFFRDYMGTVASRPIVAELVREGYVVSGGYSYSSKPGGGSGFDLTLDGVINGERLVLNEFVAWGKKAGTATGQLVGELTPEGTFRGVFKSPDGKRSFPFEWQVKETRGSPGRFAFDVASVRLTESTPSSGLDDPVGMVGYDYDLLLLDRRKGFVVRTLARDRPMSVHGACGPGRYAPPGREFDDPSVLAAYRAAFPEDRVVAFDVVHDSCERAYGRLLAVLVVEREGVLYAVGRRAESTALEKTLETTDTPEFEIELNGVAIERARGPVAGTKERK